MKRLTVCHDGRRPRLGRVSLLGLAACVAAVGLGAAPAPRVIHVSPAGSDAAPGSAESPVKTIGRALAFARPGDRVVVHAGTYQERVVVKTSGEPGKPIVIEGERSPEGRWLTVVGATGPWTGQWVPAPEVGRGVYKAPAPGFEPAQMLVDGKFIPRIWPKNMKDGKGFEKLAYPATQQVKTMYLQADVNYWDTMAAMFGCRDGMVYIRFRNGDDPNGKQLRAAPAGGGIQIENQSHIVLRNLMVRGGENCVMISGPKAAHNVVEHCRLVNGSKRVYVTDRAAHNTIRHNDVTIDLYADTCKTGAWGCGQKGDAAPYEFRVKEHFYNEYKYFFGPNSTSDYGIRLYRVGEGNEVHHNRVYMGGQGISINQASHVRVHHNTVYGFSSIGLICTLNRVADVQLYDNLVYDCNINLRIHHVNEPRQDQERSLYVYRNRFYEPPGVGSHIYFHYWKDNDVTPYRHAHVFIYHNSFAGGRACVSLSGYADECGGLPNAVVVNNMISSQVGVYAAMPFVAGEGMWGLFDCNWLGGQFKTRHPGHDYTKAPWFGKGNVFVKAGRAWDDGAMPDFALPADSAARNGGVDVTQPIVAGGRTFGPLPGFEPGYYTGPKPHMGAVQGK